MSLNGIGRGLGPLEDFTGEAAEAAAPRPGGGPADRGIEALFRTQAPRLLKRLARCAVGREDALDLIQEGFLRMLRAARERPAPLNPEAYLERIVGNLMRDQARRAAVRGDRLHDPVDPETLTDGGPGPEDVLCARELLQRYQQALRGLRPKTRTVFLLHRRDGFTYAEIATRLGQSVSNVEKHMMRAIAHLDRVLEVCE
jgi:RNA polymerase sigma-70 factor (ECF subfamily)